ncbi:hypothetical protein ABIA33_006549 [Streptacidiphilus sp. MAP12-16]|uniref:DUF7848 domain-containing protein n=1 Tax=Streptacidiphilus sp. MAP12-16 TaxID=3156300 RepID=UPI0035193A24
MAAHTVLRFVQWTMRQLTTEMPRRMVCDACGEGSEETPELTAAQDWAFQHVGRNPSHTSYSETVTRFWDMTA